MPRSENHVIPVLEELRARDTANPRPSRPDPVAERKARNWGGRRPGAGAPIGNLNALKRSLS